MKVLVCTVCVEKVGIPGRTGRARRWRRVGR